MRHSSYAKELSIQICKINHSLRNLKKKKNLTRFFKCDQALNAAVWTVLPCSQHWDFAAAAPLTAAHCNHLHLRSKRCLWATFLQLSCLYKWIAFWNAHDPSGIQAADPLARSFVQVQVQVRAKAAYSPAPAQCPQSHRCHIQRPSKASKPGELEKMKCKFHDINDRLGPIWQKSRLNYNVSIHPGLFMGKTH